MDDILSSMSSAAGYTTSPALAPSGTSKSQKMACSNPEPETEANIWNSGIQINSDVCVETSEASDARNTDLNQVYPSLEIQRQKSVRSLKKKLNDAVEQMGISSLSNSVYEEWMFCLRLNRDTRGTDRLIPSSNADSSSLHLDLIKAGASKRSAKTLSAKLRKEATKLARALARFQASNDGFDPKKGIQVKLEDDQYHLSYQQVHLKLNVGHYAKLQSLYSQHQEHLNLNPKTQLKRFHQALFCLLLRYDSLQGGGYQAAMNEECFDVILRTFDCRMECFASPLNCRYGQYCSAFLDTDRAFGSLGSFFEFVPKSGCFEANPPFIPQLIRAMALHMHTILKSATAPLCFIIIVPEWKDDPSWNLLEQNEFNKRRISIAQKEHGFLEGLQQHRPTRWRISSCDTSVFFWMNAAGEQRYPITEVFTKDLIQAFAPKQKQERLDKGLRQGGQKVRKLKLAQSTPDDVTSRKRLRQNDH